MRQHGGLLAVTGEQGRDEGAVCQGRIAWRLLQRTRIARRGAIDITIDPGITGRKEGAINRRPFISRDGSRADTGCQGRRGQDKREDADR